MDSKTVKEKWFLRMGVGTKVTSKTILLTEKGPLYGLIKNAILENG